MCEKFLRKPIHLSHIELSIGIEARPLIFKTSSSKRKMTSTSTSFFQVESLFINKPPFFDGSDYHFWKNKMTWYLKSIDLEVWKTISFGYTFPTMDVDGNIIVKSLDEYNDEEKKEFQLN